jgi:hypothetical protein
MADQARNYGGRGIVSPSTRVPEPAREMPAPLRGDAPIRDNPHGHALAAGPARF